MLSRRFIARPRSVLAFLLGITACSAEAPPPPTHSAGSARASAPVRGGRTATGGSTTSLGDSALEPAAAEAAKDEEWARSESLYRELVRRQPRSGSARQGLGVALMHQQKNADAIAALEESVRLSDNAGARLDLAAAFGAEGRYPSALPHLRKAVQLSPRKPEAWTALADALVKVEKPEAAADTLRESHKVCPSCAANDGYQRATEEVARAASIRAEKQVEAGDNLAGARKSAELAVALRPQMSEGHLSLGKVARAEGDTKTAADAFRKAVERAPDAAAAPGAGARLELASLLLGNGNPSEAVKLAEEVVAARGDDGAALDTLGRACEATRDTACARKAYAKLVTLPEDGKAKGAVEHARLRMKVLKPGKAGKARNSRHHHSRADRSKRGR